MDPFYEQTGVRILTICVGPTKTTREKVWRDLAYDDKTGEELVAMDEEHRKTHEYQK